MLVEENIFMYLVDFSSCPFAKKVLEETPVSDKWAGAKISLIFLIFLHTPPLPCKLLQPLH